MRKELTVYGDTIELGEEFSVASVTNDREYVILKSGISKFTAKVVDLEECLKALKEFSVANSND